MIDEFTPGSLHFNSSVDNVYLIIVEFILRCKKTYVPRSAGSGDSALHKVCRTGKLVS